MPEKQIIAVFGATGAQGGGLARAILRARDPALSRELNPELQGFDAWLAANAGRIPRE